MTMSRLGPVALLAIALLGFSGGRAAEASRPPAVVGQATVAQITLPKATPPAVAGGVVAQGVYLLAPIVLDGATLFRIAAPINAPASQMPVSARVTQIETALSELIAKDGPRADATTIFDPRTLRVYTQDRGDAVVLEAVDAKHTDPLPILTVTAVDARANSTDVDALASQWQATLQSALEQALVLRQPAVERRSVQSVIRLAIILVAASLVDVFVLRALWRRMGELETEITARTADAEPLTAASADDGSASRQRRKLFAIALKTLKPVQRLKLYGSVAEVLLWGLALAWLISATWSLSLFAETTPLSQTIARGAFGVAATIIVAILVSRLLDAMIVRAATAYRVRRTTDSEDRARALLRIPTIARAVSGAKTFLLVFVAALSAVGQVGVPIGSVITIGGVAAIALSLAAQNFVRDFLNGFLVLLEDQYVVGDYVTINAFSGLVERFSLRMVQIRDASGDVVTIPHSSVINVVNASRNWSRVDYRVPLDPAADISAAIAIVRAQITALESEDDWMDGQTDPIEWIGIDALSRDSVIVRASIRTAPLRQFELRRRINERVLHAFATAHIALGAPLTTP